VGASKGGGGAEKDLLCRTKITQTEVNRGITSSTKQQRRPGNKIHEEKEDSRALRSLSQRKKREIENFELVKSAGRNLENGDSKVGEVKGRYTDTDKGIG